MPLSRLHLRTLMIAVAVVGMMLGLLFAWAKSLSGDFVWIKIGGFTIRLK